jgi:F-type H+-transporting ATPase subunit a
VSFLATGGALLSAGPLSFLAEAAPGPHPLTPICGDQYLNLQVIKFYYCAVTVDTLVSSAVAIAVTLLIVFLVVRRLRTGTPGKLQMVLEFLLDYVRGMVRDTVAEDATFIIPIAATIALYILVANWLEFFPLAFSPYVKPANSDLNQTLAMAIVVILVVQWYSLKAQGLGGYLHRFTRPFELPVWARALFVPLNIIEEIVKPLTLSLRLFGNLFAGVLVIYLLTLLFQAAAFWAAPSIVGLVIWKTFDVFVIGSLQAFIFMLLTIMYFGQAREGLEEELHGAHAPAASHT